LDDACSDHNTAAGSPVQMTVDDVVIVDARGHRCPVPTLRLRRALERAMPGQGVRLLADDPMAKIDVPHFCASEGYRLVSSGVEGETLVFEVSPA
jgi:tRNA 2-thiouridine synthesizing protein A